MRKIIRQSIIIFGIFPLLLLASNSQDLAIYRTVKGNIEKEYNQLVEKKLKSIGFNLTDPHKRVNDQYETKWGSTVLDVLSFMPIVRDRTILPLLNIDPRIAGFAPFNLVIHKKLDENVTYVGHLVPEVMFKILGIENEEVKSKFSAPFKALDATIAHELGGHVSTIPYKNLPKKTMINYEYEFEAPEDIDDFIDEFQNNFELAFINKGYLIAGFHNFMEATDDAEEILSNYDAFWTYSLCHLEFSYNMFDNEGARPEAGLFAPCTMYIYHRKGTNKLVVGMYRLHNWSETLDITNEKRLGLIEKLDTEIPAILEAYGMKAVSNVNPLLASSGRQSTAKATAVKTEKETVSKKTEVATRAVAAKTTPVKVDQKIQGIKIGDKSVSISIPKVPEVPKVTKFNTNGDTSLQDRSIKFSKRIPPNYRPHSFDRALKEKKMTHTRIGEVNKGKISAYLRSEFMSVDDTQSQLKQAGFDIVAAVPVNKKKDLISIVFTNKALQTMASKANRGFIGSLRALVDMKEKTMSITNPLYMAKGFLQDDFDEKAAYKILDQLIDQFPNLTNSKDVLKYQLLPKYQFMNGMPQYQDMIEVASGENLTEKLKNNDKVVFTQTLANSATLVGIRLGKRTRKFTKRIGRNNAAMLPYPILIENGKAKILDPKYYISYMYPNLTMSEFMTIATIPDAMVKDCEKVFK